MERVGRGWMIRSWQIGEETRRRIRRLDGREIVDDLEFAGDKSGGVVRFAS